MKKLALLVCLCILSFSVFGQLPKTLSFQGYLTNADGEPITNSSLELSFSLHTQKTGGSLVWGPEVHQVNVNKGIFNTILGASQITAVPLDFGGSLTFDQKYFLEIVVDPNGTPETLTRIELTSSMFSLSTLNATNITSGTLSGALLDAVDASKISGNLALTNGGTGASDAATARTNLGLTIGTDVQGFDADLTDLADGELTGSKVGTGIDAANISTGVLALANGGTEASTAAAARDNLGLTIGTDVQAYDTDLTAFGTISPSANILDFLSAANYLAARNKLGLLVGTDVQAFDADLSTYSGITPSTDVQTLLGSASNTAIRSNIGLGTIAAQDADDVTISGGSIGGITDLAVADGGTGASNAGIARSNLGLVIGTNVQAANANLTDLADGSLTGTKVAPDFGAQDIATTGGLDVGGYTTLGDDASAPAIKMITLTGTSGAAEGNDVEVLHGLTLSTIISVSVLLEASSTQSIPPGFTASAGFLFNWFLDDNGIHILNDTAQSENILSKNFKIVITYESP